MLNDAIVDFAVQHVSLIQRIGTKYRPTRAESLAEAYLCQHTTLSKVCAHRTRHISRSLFSIAPRVQWLSRQFEPIVLRERIDVDPERMNGRRRHLPTMDVLQPHETNGHKLAQGARKVRLCAARQLRELGN